MHFLENHCVAFSEFLKKTEKAIKDISKEKKENINKIAHDIELTNKEPSLSEFKSFTSNKDHYKPNAQELKSLKETLEKQSEAISKIYDDKILEHKKNITSVKDIYKKNNMEIVPIVANFLG